MINNDRIIPITVTDLLTNYATTLKIVANATSGTVPTILAATDAEGNFTQATNSATVLCSEPVKSFDFAATATAGTAYFVPAIDYKGFTTAGTAATTAGATVVADGSTLYSATLATGTVTFAKIGL